MAATKRELLTFVQEQRKYGKARSEVAGLLTRTGWPVDDTSEALDYVYGIEQVASTRSFFPNSILPVVGFVVAFSIFFTLIFSVYKQVFIAEQNQTVLPFSPLDQAGEVQVKETDTLRHGEQETSQSAVLQASTIVPEVVVYGKNPILLPTECDERLWHGTVHFYDLQAAEDVVPRDAQENIIYPFHIEMRNYVGNV